MTPTIKDFARSMFDRFEAESIPLLLAGGWAVVSYGFPRNTLDIDWVCRRSQETDAVALMKRLGFVPRTDGMATRFQFERDLAFPFVDLIWVNDDTFGKLDGEDDPVTGIRVVSFEGLLAMKLVALRDEEHRKGRDLRDIQELLARNPDRVTGEDLRYMCLKYAGEGTFERLGCQP